MEASLQKLGSWNSTNYFLAPMERKRDNVLLLSYEQTLSFAAHQLSQCGALISASNQDSECERAIVKNLRTTLKLMRPMSLVGQEDAARALDKLEPLRLGAKAREGARARRSSGDEGARPARVRRESGELQATAVVGLQNWKQQVVQRIKQAETQLTGRKFSSRWRQGLYELLELPESSRGAFVLQWFLIVCISASTLTFIIETMPEARGDETATAVLFFFEAFFTLIFTVELLCRLLVAKPLTNFFCSWLVVVDVLSVAPFYVTLLILIGRLRAAGGAASMLSILASDQIRTMTLLRVLRVLRVLRLLKVGRHYFGLQLIATTLRQSIVSIGLFIVIGLFLTIVSATILYFVETSPDPLDYRSRVPTCYPATLPRHWGSTYPGAYNSTSGEFCTTPFMSITRTCWFATVTLLKVGYGDVVPETVAGKLVASFIALAGVLLIALPLAVIGQSFVSSYNVYINAHVATEMRRKVAAKIRRESRGQRNSGQERRSSENESQPAGGVSLFQSS